MNPRLNIVSVCRSLPLADDPSSGIFVFNRLAAMHEQADVRIVQPIPYTPLVKPLPRWARLESRTIGRIAINHAPMLYVPKILKSVDSLWLSRAIGPGIEQMHRSHPIDAIDAHFGYPEGVGCVRVAKRFGIPVFITVRGFENEYLRKPGIAGQLVAAMNAATGCICVSHSLREVIIKHGVESSRVQVVHNAIDSTTFSRGDRPEARKRLGIPNEKSLILSVGHMVARKRHHVLLDAFARVRQRLPDTMLAFIGARSFETGYQDRLVSQAEALGLAEAVRFIGNVPPAEVALWLQAADVFALGTSREGCCNAVLEALAVGLPVVTTPVGDNAYFIKDGFNGYIVPVDDAEAFAHSIQRAIAGDDWDRDAISQGVIRQVGSWKGVAERVLGFMRERTTGAPVSETPGANVFASR